MGFFLHPNRNRDRGGRAMKKWTGNQGSSFPVQPGVTHDKAQFKCFWEQN